jgi:hypothetical protein
VCGGSRPRSTFHQLKDGAIGTLPQAKGLCHTCAQYPARPVAEVLRPTPGSTLEDKGLLLSSAVRYLRDPPPVWSRQTADERDRVPVVGAPSQHDLDLRSSRWPHHHRQLCGRRGVESLNRVRCRSAERSYLGLVPHFAAGPLEEELGGTIGQRSSGLCHRSPKEGETTKGSEDGPPWRCLFAGRRLPDVVHGGCLLA